MKSTIKLPDNLFAAVKRRAAEDGTTVQAIVERGLWQQLGSPKGSVMRTRRAIKWVTVDGGLPKGLALRDRTAMHDRLLIDR